MYEWYFQGINKEVYLKGKEGKENETCKSDW